MKHEWTQMRTNGKMARMIGVDPKTLRKWARQGKVPSYINPVNGYRYYFITETIKALKEHTGSTSRPIDQPAEKC